MSATNSITGICKLFSNSKFNFTDEYELQAGIEQLLKGMGVTFEREVRINKQDRLDFLTAEGIAIEIKVDGSLSSVTRQLFRYAEKPEVKQLILVTNRTRHRQIPREINGKPVYLVELSSFV